MGWTKTASYLGWLTLPKLEGGAGLPAESAQSLAWLAVKSQVDLYIRWRVKRCGGKFNGGVFEFLAFVACVLRQGTGYLYQQPEFKATLAELLGATYGAYRCYLVSLFDEFATELPALFGRFSAQGLLFPGEQALLQLVECINHHDVSRLWGEDEAIGWVYQYFNSKEERKKMRDASTAPRDSRELAVRNQFFTPRYVVEFLVDNTLGRLWLEMTQGHTRLAHDCPSMLVPPNAVFELYPTQYDEPPPGSSVIQFRQGKDPREIRFLDPACGSMHFGLYAFDLFETIYQEAWRRDDLYAPESLKPLRQCYQSEDAYRRDIPRLIIEHNIYGVDIDPRAAQIASLALWLRAQRSWHDAGVKAKDRPVIGRGNVVAAVAPPAEPALRAEFSKSLGEKDAVLFGRTLDLLKGLPEMGVLLRIERKLRELVEEVFWGHGPRAHRFQDQHAAFRDWARIYRVL